MGKVDVAIIGAGLSGAMMYQRLTRDWPNFKVMLIDRAKAPTPPDYGFHLHKPLKGLSGFDNIEPIKWQINVWDGTRLKRHPSIMDINEYAFKLFDKLQVSNINNIHVLGAYAREVYPVDPKALRDKLMGSKELAGGLVNSINLNNHTLVVSKDDGGHAQIEYRYLINTAPLHCLLTLADVDTDVEFKHTPINVAKFDFGRHTNLWQQIYASSPQNQLTRITLMDRVLYMEFTPTCGGPNQLDITLLNNLYPEMDIDPVTKKVYPGRIEPLSNSVRKPLLYWLTGKHDVMCLGRYGAWTYKVATDVWEDTIFLSKLIYTKEQSLKYGGEK